METKETNSWQDEAALSRFQTIQPLTDPALDQDKKILLRKKISGQTGISEKTLRRYEAAFASGGFAGLKPKDRTKQVSKQLPGNFQELLNEAIQLKREVPGRSVSQIIYILEGEGRALPDTLKRSTLQRYLFNAGFGVKQMRKLNEGLRSSSAKRFCKPHRMMLLQADIKYGPYLPIGKNGKKIRTYLTSILDDHSRFVLVSTFYDNQEKAIVEDTFHRKRSMFQRVT